MKYIDDLEFTCLQDGTCRRPTIWWADGEEEPSAPELNPPFDFLLEAWPKGWDEEILSIQSAVRTMIAKDLTGCSPGTNVCLPDCSEDGMCGKCMFERVYNCISTEHGTNQCTTQVEKSEKIKRLEDVVKFIDLLKKNNHILTGSD